MKKIFIIGNLAGGKTTLAKKISASTQIPVLHMDSIQFDQNLELRPRAEIKATLDQFESRSSWIIDGFGPFEWIEKRMADSDLVIFVDLPLWRHRFWFFKRLLQSLFKKRSELPESANELQFLHIKKAWKQMIAVERGMKPQLRKILKRPDFHDRVIWISKLSDFKKTLKQFQA